MPFGIKSEGFWGKKELSYQHVHMFWAFWIAYAVCLFLPFWYMPLVIGALCGVVMETFQAVSKIITGIPQGSKADAFRDLCFWTLGGCLNYLL